MDIGQIDSLKSIVDEGDSVVIGAMAPYYEISGPLGPDGLGLLHKAISEVADPQIRHRGTLGGRSRTPIRPATAGRRPWRWTRAGHGWPGRERTWRRPTSSRASTPPWARTSCSWTCGFPKLTGWGSRYEKFVRWPMVDRGGGRGGQGRRRHDQRGPDGLTNMGSAACGPRLSSRRSSASRRPRTAYGKRAKTPRTGTNPPSDLNGDAEYRRHLAKVLTRRAVLAAPEAEHGPAARVHRPGDDRPDLVGVQRHRVGGRCFPAPRSPRSRGTRSPEPSRSSSAHRAGSTTAPAPSWRRTSPHTGW